jgi:calmodulin
MADIFSQEQIEKFRVIFEQFDKNGDGDISAKELKGALKQLGQVTDTKSCKKMIKAVKTVHFVLT